MFTPWPYQIELVNSALKRNTIACLNSPSVKTFVWTTYLKEILGHHFAVVSKSGKKALAFSLFNSDYLVEEYGINLRIHLDKNVVSVTSKLNESLTQLDWENLLVNNQVIVTSPQVMAEVLKNMLLDPSVVGVLVLDDCHNVLNTDSDYLEIIQILNSHDCKPCILGLTCSLLKDDISAALLEQQIKQMEKLLGCKAETATDLIALDGCSPTKPDEKIVLCGNKKQVLIEEDSGTFNPKALTSEIREILVPAVEWLKVCQIGSSTKLTNNMAVNDDSKEEPEENTLDENLTAADSTEVDVKELVDMSLTVLSQVLLVLDILGLWCAHRFVILLLKQLQKSIKLQDTLEGCEDDPSKLKYFLLRYTDSHLRTIYKMCQSQFGCKKKVDLTLVTPKVYRLLQVLKEYKPPPELDKKGDSKSNKHNDRTESGYVPWWQDSDAEEDEEEEQMMNRSQEKGTDEEDVASGRARARQYHHPNSLCGIVFVKDKHIALMLQRLLKEVSKEDPELWHVASSHITSIASNDSDDEVLDKSDDVQDTCQSPSSTEKLKQEEVLRSFRSHEINLLVSTNCLQEYAEIPKCNLVLRFDVPTTYKSYILSKSRVRATNSTYMMLVNEEEKTNFMIKLQEYKKIENVLQNSSAVNQNDATIPDDYLDSVDVEESDDEIVLARAPPYFSTPTICATLDSAIHIINRYCSRLPSDPFTYLSPRCEVVEEREDPDDSDDYLDAAIPNKSYRGKLQLPINSQVRSVIEGPAMPTVVLAQKAVALEACRVLHKAREIDDHFMPMGKEMMKYANELYTWPNEKSGIPGRPGTTKRRQTYYKEIPLALSDCLPKPNIPLFLYEISMKLKTRLPESLNVRRRTLHAPEDTTRCFGILMAKPLTSTVGFPIFTRSGEESVSIKPCRSFITLGEHHIKMIRSFHHYIFSDMLRVDRAPLVFCPEAAKMQIFVVILDKTSPQSKLDIDWRFMSKVSSKRRIEERMHADPWFRHKLLESKGGKVFVFNRRKYEDGVVVAKYRSPDQPNRFYVAEIKDELNPYSSFPSSEYESFHHYYKIKYGLDISCLSQPLLDVDHTSSRLNLLTPRYMNHKGKVLPVTSLEKKRAKYETLTNRQILVPELCDVHPIPASLWRKAVCIPSMLYRVSSVLLAEELRLRIYRESNIGEPKLPLGRNWPDLDFGWGNERFHYETLEESNSFSDTEVYKSDISHDAEDTHNAQNTSQSDLESDIPVAKEVKIEERINESETKLQPTTNGNAESSDSDIDFNYDRNEYEHLFCFEGDDSKNGKHERRTSTGENMTPPHTFAVIPKASILALSEDREKPSVNRKFGPSPGLILQALTLSNASDGFNLERLEMLGDSFLKHAVTVYLFCTYPEAHEGKLSYMRSKKVSNYNLYRIGQHKNLPGKMVAHIFDPAVNWSPPGYVFDDGKIPCSGDGFVKSANSEDMDDEMEIGVWTGVPGQILSSVNPVESDLEINKPSVPSQPPTVASTAEEGDEDIFDEDEIQMIDNMLGRCLIGGMNGLNGGHHHPRQNGFPTTVTGRFIDRGAIERHEAQNQRNHGEFVIDTWTPVDAEGKPLCATDPLIIDLHTQHSLADKSIADCVEAILGSYLTTCGHRSAQLLLCYFGLKVLPRLIPGDDNTGNQALYGYLKPPQNVLLNLGPSGVKQLELFTKDLSAFEQKINYTFRNKAYLLQAFTHASYYLNSITDCYQRLEFLGDAVLDFLITCQLFNDPTKQHSPGALTDLRSALVNNTIFASLAVRHDFHKFFKAISPEMSHIIDEFVRYQLFQEEAQGMDAQLAKKYYPTTEDSLLDSKEIIVNPGVLLDAEDADEEEEEEDVEVPKALGDIFESVAGAIYMDSGMDLDEVWRVYEPMMGPLIEKFSSCVPRAPVRELLEMEPETAKFSWAEKRCDGKVRVTVEVIGKGSFKGVGRSFRIAKSAAARRALRFLKSGDNC